MSINADCVAKTSLDSARRELTSMFPMKTGMSFYLGRAGAANFIDPSPQTQAALNEITFLSLNYAYRHNIYKG